MSIRLYDAHNHLQDARLAPQREAVFGALQREGVAGMVVNGSGEEDWPEVLALARAWPQVIPSFGLHPWYVKERSPDWQAALVRHLDAVPSAIGRPQSFAAGIHGRKKCKSTRGALRQF